jgi:hypothetical protein
MYSYETCAGQIASTTVPRTSREGKTDEVHPVARRRDEADVRDGVERAQLVERQALVHKVDGHEVDGAEPAVDAADELVDGAPQVLVLLDVLPRGHRELDEHDLADPLGVLREEELERVQLLRDALDVVEPVDADDDLDALEAALERREAVLDDLLLQVLRGESASGLGPRARTRGGQAAHGDEALGVDADGEGADVRESPFELDAVGHRRQAEDARARGEEVPRVVVRVEADQVRVEDAEQDLAADREDSARGRPSDTEAREGHAEGPTGRSPTRGRACAGKSRS